LHGTDHADTLGPFHDTTATLSELGPLTSTGIAAPRPAGTQRRRLHVAVVDEELPYPLNSGKRIRTANLILQLARRHRIAYLCYPHADPAETRDAEDFFRSHGIEPVVADRALPEKRGPTFYGRLLLNLLSPLPYSVQVPARGGLRRLVATYAAEHAVDLWHCEFTPYLQVLEGLPTEPCVAVAHNVESLIWERYYRTETNPAKRWYIGRQWRKFLRFERRALGEADRVVTVSENDASLAGEQFGASRLSVVDNGVDTSYFRPAAAPRKARQILFLGALDWRPNLDAAAALLDTIFPRVLAEEPSTRLCLVGRRPPGWLVQRAGRAENVELHADVPDVRPFMERSSVMAVPLRIGGGSRLKILEAAAAELPVVATRIGAEGLCLVPGKHFVEVDSIEAMPGALLECLRDAQGAAKMAAAARQVAAARYDWSVLADRLEEVWMRCVRL